MTIGHQPPPILPSSLLLRNKRQTTKRFPSCLLLPFLSLSFSPSFLHSPNPFLHPNLQKELFPSTPQFLLLLLLLGFRLSLSLSLSLSLGFPCAIPDPSHRSQEPATYIYTQTETAMSGRPQVTITLGCSGQVVKRDAADGEGRHSDHHGAYAAGAKRQSVRDRLGDDNYARNQRQRRETDKWTRSTDMNNDRQNTPNCRIGRDDLRLKLMHKNLSRRMKEKEQNGRYLRGKYSTAHQRHSRYDALEDIPVSKSSSHFRRIPPTRSAEDLLHMESLRKSYSSWNMNGVRHRSPDRFLGASRRFDGVSSIRSVEPPLQTTYMAKNVIDSSRPVSYMAKGPVNVQGPKPIMHLPPPGTGVPKSAFTFEEHLTVGGLLNALGLGKYAILFQAEEVDMAALKQMGDGDLKDLGIPMGPRKKILLAVAPRPKQRPA